MLYGGSFEPAYTLTITALPSYVQPVTNKRNAALLAKAMEENLGVASDRGIIKFMTIPEENLATSGRTVAGEIEELEKESGDTGSLPNRSASRATNRKRQSMRSLRGKLTVLSNVAESAPPTPTFPNEYRGSTAQSGRLGTPKSERVSTPLPPMPPEPSLLDKKAEKVRKMGRRKSFIATIFGKS
jgi:hypothetical protein